MKLRKRIAVACASLGLALGAASAQEPIIASFSGNGQLTWTNAVNNHARYRIEWAAQATGPWFRTFANIGSLDAHSATGFAVTVPMFYRVVMATNPPPAGMVWIEGGDVELGQADIATPVHTNFISGCWMDEMEVTIDKWREVYDWALTNGYVFDHAGYGLTNSHPVSEVNWFDCLKWCNARSEMEGLVPNYQYLVGPVFLPYTSGQRSNLVWRSNGYRLPTEAEWEKGARGGRQGRLFPWGGDTISHKWANYYATTTNFYPYDVNPVQGFHPLFSGPFGGYGLTSPVGSFPANGYGLHDMAGNVWEWCWDWSAGYSADYAVDPRGPGPGVYRAKRGGTFNNDAGFGGIGAFLCRAGARAWDLPTGTAGFRCVRGP